MEHGFEPHPSGAFIALSDGERALLVSLGRQTIAMLTDRAEPSSRDPLADLVGIGSHDEPPEDPVLARILPSGYADDGDAREFRRFTEVELLRGKLAAAQSVMAAIEAADRFVIVGPEDQYDWLTFLNDLRLALGTRIGVREDAMEELANVADDDPRLPMLLVYDWLTYVQGSLVEMLMLQLPDSGIDDDESGPPASTGPT
jgi:hypothetical protein